MRNFILGLLVYPSIRVAWFCVWLLCVTCRDTFRRLRNAELKEGYSKFNWLIVIPQCFLGELGEHLNAWMNGMRREVWQ